MDRKAFFPVALNLQGRDCLVIGRSDDREAISKAQAFEECGAGVRRLHDPQSISEDDLAGAFFVVSTVVDRELSARLRRMADEHRFLLCCIDQPEFGFVSMTAIAKSGPVLVAISTSGVAPSVSKDFRKALQRAMDAKFSRFIERLGSLRKNVRERLSDPSQALERISCIREASRDFRIAISFSYPEWFEKTEQ